MKRNSSFDDRIKGQFSDYQPDVPAHIWENIMAKKEREKPVGFLFRLYKGRLKFILLGLLILTATGIVFYQRHANPVKIHGENNEIAGNKSQAPDLQNQREKTNAGKSSSGLVVLPIDPGIKNINTGRSSDQAETKSQSPGENTDAAAGEKLNRILISKDKTRRNDIVLEIPSIVSAGAMERDRITTESGEALTKNTAASHLKMKSKIYAGNGEIASYKRMLLAKGNKGKKTQAGLVSVKTENSDISEEKKSLPAFTTQSTSVNQMPEPRLNKYTLNLETLSPYKSKSFPLSEINGSMLNVPCPTLGKDAISNKRYFEIYGGPDYAFRTLNDTANSSYLQKRKESTSFSSAFSLGIRYTKVFSSGFSFRTGINFSQVNEKFRFVDGHIVQLVYSTDNEGDTTGSYISTGTRYKTTHNKYRTIDIPLLIGYEFGASKLHANINFGPVINAYSWQKGDVLDTLNQPVNITTGKSNSAYQFKTNTGVGFMGAASIYYHLSGSFSLLAEPYIRYNLSAANKAELTLKQKYTTVGLRLGIKINF